jgi:hypothetical protein
MANELAVQEADKTFSAVAKDKGYSKEAQLESLKWMGQIAEKKIDFAKDMGGRIMDLANTREKNKVEMARIDQADRDSQRKYELAREKLDTIRATLLFQFSRQDKMIDKGFEEVDRAIEAGEWGAAVAFFGKMTDMVSKSPLAAAIEFNEKMKSGTLSLDDF